MLFAAHIEKFYTVTETRPGAECDSDILKN